MERSEYKVTKLTFNLFKLSRLLCKNISKNIKRKEILYCHSPILTCVLLNEFLQYILDNSEVNTANNEKVIQKLNKFCLNMQESNADEDYIKFLMSQKDSRERSVFEIVSTNNMYSVLQSNVVSTIMKKMWNGRIPYNGKLSE